MESKSESDLHTEQLIIDMMSFLDEPAEPSGSEDFDESKNELCAGVRKILNMFPSPPAVGAFRNSKDDIKPFSDINRKKSDQMDSACRYKDPYMQEVNRLMFSSNTWQPPNGSREYFQAAEYYALHGKEFLDFPPDNWFPKPMGASSCFDDVSSQFPSSLQKQSELSKCKSPHLCNTSVPQLPFMLNPTNYCNYSFYQTPPNFVQPLIYSNPLLMTQYRNMFVQQQQMLTGGIQERLIYPQMLQQQAPTNQTAPANSGFLGATGSGVVKQMLSNSQDLKKIESSPTTGDTRELIKSNSNSRHLCENVRSLDE